MHQNCDQITLILHAGDAAEKYRLVSDSGVNFTAEHIEMGLTDRHSSIRQSFAERMDFVFTWKQIARGLLDQNWIVRLAFASRDDYTLTQKQIAYGIRDSEASVRKAFAKRQEYLPTREEELQGLNDFWIRDVFEKRKEEWEMRRERDFLKRLYAKKEELKKKKCL